jgi:putative SOS response-associated peptidase YedK
LSPQRAAVAEWGFVPNWVKKKQQAYDPNSPYNNLLNAQAQTMFDKPAFRKAARYGRCLVQIDAYYESHHYKGKTYPFRIFKKDGSPMLIAAICRKARWVDEETGEEIVKNVLATLTCTANEQLAKIHNNPSMLQRGNGHRMLVILDEEQAHEYLKAYPSSPGQAGNSQMEKKFEEDIKKLCTSYPSDLLNFHSVRNLRDRKNLPYLGNVPEIREAYTWPDLDYSRVS